MTDLPSVRNTGPRLIGTVATNYRLVMLRLIAYIENEVKKKRKDKVVNHFRLNIPPP